MKRLISLQALAKHSTLMLCAAAVAVSACGHKGNLKTPTQAKIAEEKKEKKQADRAARDAKRAAEAESEKAE
jgi:predicted small lipoprotein YifL